MVAPTGVSAWGCENVDDFVAVRYYGDSYDYCHISIWLLLLH